MSVVAPSAVVYRNEDVDIDVRCLVSLLNQWPGLRTLASCAGHGNELGAGISEAYVCFTADDQATVRDIVDTIPNWGAHATFSGFQVLVRYVGITVDSLDRPDLDPKALVYRLMIAGTPLYHQRAQIETIERALCGALAKR